jgi:hypothetical protein
MSDVSINVEGIASVQEALGRLTGPEARKMLQKGATKAAIVLRRSVKAAAPGPTRPGYKGQKPGDLKRAVSYAQTRRIRPGARVWVRKEKAFYRIYVVGGAGPHNIRFPSQVKAGVQRSHLPATAGGGNIRHPGVRTPNPFVARGFDAGLGAAEAAIDKVFTAYLASL